MGRPRIRQQSQFLLYSATTTLGWSVARTISFAEGERGVADEGLCRVVDEFGRHVGYQPKNGVKEPEPSNEFDPSTISRHELEANAGLRGKSRTEHLPDGDHRRRNRRHPLTNRLMPEEDFVERARNKVKAWPATGGLPIRMWDCSPEEILELLKKAGKSPEEILELLKKAGKSPEEILELLKKAGKR